MFRKTGTIQVADKIFQTGVQAHRIVFHWDNGQSATLRAGERRTDILLATFAVRKDDICDGPGPLWKPDGLRNTGSVCQQSGGHDL